MSQVYASNVDRINDQIRSLGVKDFDSKEEMGQQLVAEEKASALEKTQEYLDKWKDVQEAGDEDLAALLGVKELYHTYKGVKSLFKKYKSATSQETKAQESDEPSEEVGEDSHVIDAEEPGQTMRDFGLSEEDAGKLFEEEDVLPREQEMTSFSEPTIEPTTTLSRGSGLQETSTQATIMDEDPEEIRPTMRIGGEQKAGPAEGDVPESTTESDPQDISDLAESGAAETGEAAAETGAEAAGEAAAAIGEVATGVGIADAATAAIPVVGEAVALVGGLVTIGDAFYHLFHHPHHSAPKPPPPVAPVPTAQLFSSKLAAGLPSTDAGLDRPASSTLF